VSDLRDRLTQFESTNERLVSIEIVRQVLLLRYSLHLRMVLIDALNDTEHPIASVIRDSLHTEAGFRDPAQVAALDRMIDQINAMRAPAWTAGRDAVVSDLLEFAAAEVEDHHSILMALVPALGLILPAAGTVAAQALATPYQGRTVRQWIDDAQAAEAKRIRQAIYLGVGAGEDPATVARRVVGSAAMRGADGATQTSRNYVDTLTRSSLVHVATLARSSVYEQNSEVLTTEQFVAVLDSHTTELCRSLNGRRYPLRTGPRPPLHMNCRSMRVVVLPEQLGGPVWEPEVYDAWIRKQPWAVRLELLGATRAAQTRSSSVDLGAFVDYGSRPSTLQQVRAKAKRLMGAYN
jgi:SPP1 gp7 family putative phage head morphogenesis protein